MPTYLDSVNMGHNERKTIAHILGPDVKYEEAKKRRTEFALSIMQKISKVSDMIILESLTVRKKNIHGRVAYILLFFADQIYEDKYFELPLNRREIAEFIGKTTENVIRTLSEFRKDGIIKIFGKFIEIVDKEKLQQISDFG